MKREHTHYYVYVLFSLVDHGLYVGFCADLKVRLGQHARGEVQSTGLRLPFLLIHYEYFINKHDAKSREEYLKSGYGRRQLKEIIKNTLDSLQCE